MSDIQTSDFTCRGSRHAIGVANVRAFDAVPDDFLPLAPFSEPIDAVGNEPEIVCCRPALSNAGDGVDR